MTGFLVGYESANGNIYRIYHPATKKLKVSRDVIFHENQFFEMRHVGNKDDAEGMLELGIPNEGTENELDMEILASESDAESKIREQQVPEPILYDEIIVQLIPRRQESIRSQESLWRQESKPPNRSTRRRIAKAFKAILKGNSKWPRTYHEAMEMEDAKQWELAMKKEYESIMKNKTWMLVPRPKNAKVVKSRWVLRSKDNGMYKA